MTLEKTGKLEKLSKRLAEEMKKQKEIITGQKDQLEELKSTYSDSVSSKNDCDTIIGKLKAHIKKMQEEKKAIDAANQVNSVNLAEFQEKETSHSKENKELTRRISEFEEKEKEMLEKSASDANRIEVLQNSEKELRSTADRFALELQSFTTESESESLKEAKITISQLELRVSELQEENTANESLSKIADLEQEFDQSKSRIRQLETRENELSERCELAAARILDLESEANKNEKDSAAKERRDSEESAAKEQLKELQQRLDEQQLKYDDKEAEVENVRREFEDRVREFQDESEASSRDHERRWLDENAARLKLAELSSSQERRLLEADDALSECRRTYEDRCEAEAAESEELRQDKKTLMLNLAALRDQFDVALEEVNSLEQIQASIQQQETSAKEHLSEQKRINELVVCYLFRYIQDILRYILRYTQNFIY